MNYIVGNFVFIPPCAANGKDNNSKKLCSERASLKLIF